MTLNVSSYGIEVRNSLGQTKFNSSNKLLYLIKESTGTIAVNGQTHAGVTTTKSSYGSSDITSGKFVPIISVKINSCSGSNFPSSLLGVVTPANRSILIHFAAGTVDKNLGRVSPYGNMGILSTTPTYLQPYISPYVGLQYDYGLTFTTLMYDDQWAQPKMYDFGINLTYYYRLYAFA